mmetsp:Transcript_9239/g.4885  ORF Transcript_9239/g.4885 Transcript_9239/m.4885 type:complete len:200 (-) Transcript_9239:612-1211(-)
MASTQSASTPMASRYNSLDLSNSSRMNRQLPLLTNALALYRSFRIAISAYFSALRKSFSKKYKKLIFVEALPIITLSFFSKALKTLIALSNYFLFINYMALKISISLSTTGQLAALRVSMTQSKPVIHSLSMTGAISLAASMISLKARFLLSRMYSFNGSVRGVVSSRSCSSSSSSPPGSSILNNLVNPFYILSFSPKA